VLFPLLSPPKKTKPSCSDVISRPEKGLMQKIRIKKFHKVGICWQNKESGDFVVLVVNFYCLLSKPMR
jgi:hypothetical protein